MMKNNILFLLKSKVKLKIKGKNIERFIKKLIKNNIEIIKLTKISYNEIDILVKKEDYEKILDIKTIYDISLINTYGILKIKRIMNINKVLIISILLGLILLYILTNTIFKIEVIHSNKEIRNLLINELEKRGIKKYRFKKSYDKLNIIKKEILNDYKDKLEWIEIEEKGVKYIIRVEDRIQKEEQQQINNRHIIARKSSIIKKIIAEKGEKVKNINDYVSKDEIIISGEIKLNEEVKQNVPALGKVFGEVWYETEIEYPFVYYEIKDKNNKKRVFTLKILNKRIELFNFKKFKEKQIKEKKLITNKLLPIELVKEEQKEVEIIDQVLTTNEAIIKGIEKAKKQIEENLKEDEYIINYKLLKSTTYSDKVSLKIFFSVYENITSYMEIK